MNKKIGILGHFAIGKEFYDGQTIKTKILYKELKKKVDEDSIEYVDIFGWKRNFLRILINTISMSRKCDNIIIILSKKGRNLFIPILYICKLFFGTNLHCIVLGGGFPEQMKKHKIVKFISKKIDGIYVETNKMMISLNRMGYKNNYLLNNFKNLNIIDENDLNMNIINPLKLCTFSRVCKEKGIEDIIESIININNKQKEVIYTLDIYGQIQEDYKNTFYKIIRETPDYIRYKGIVEFDKSVDVVKEYFMLVFPTLYKTEGVPGTIIDAYAAGVPVIASEWDSWSDVVDKNITGITYKFGNVKSLEDSLVKISNNPNDIISLKKNCLRKAYEYNSDTVINKLLNILKINYKEIVDYEN